MVLFNDELNSYIEKEIEKYPIRIDWMFSDRIKNVSPGDGEISHYWRHDHVSNKIYHSCTKIEIKINTKGMDLHAFLNAFHHELFHVEQILNGDLYIDHHGRQFNYGYMVDNIPYLEKPCEKEAFYKTWELLFSKIMSFRDYMRLYYNPSY